MSGTERKAIRAAAKLALRNDPALAAFTEISAWVQSIDATTLPAWAVATPQERRDRQSDDHAQEDVTLAVIVKRLGDDDIEDQLDDDSAAVDAAICAALRDQFTQVELAQTETKLDGEGARRVGTLTMAFTVTYWVDDPA